MTDEDIKRLRDEAVRETVEELMDGGRDDLANLITALWCDVDRLTRERDDARVVSEARRQSYTPLLDEVGRLRDRAERAEAEAERLRKAQAVWDDLDAQTGRHPQGPVVALVDRAERAEKVVERVRNPSAAARAAMSEALDRWYAVGTQRIPFRLPASAFYPVARALYDAATAHAKPADTPQADIVGGEASEGGGGETKAFARGRPLMWNVMGDGR